MKEILEAKIAKLEEELIKQNLEISNLTGFVKGHANGFNVAKHQVLDLLRELPEVEANTESITTFLRTLSSVITRIQEIKPMFESKIDK
jgi:hypothetical protein